MFSVLGGRQEDPSHAMYEILQSIFAVSLSVILNGTVNSIFESHQVSVMPKRGSSMATGSLFGVTGAVNLTPVLSFRSKEVALGPPSGMERPYRCQPGATKARKVTVPVPSAAVFTKERHLTGVESF